MERRNTSLGGIYLLKVGFHCRRSWSRSRSRRSASDLVKIENRSRKRSRKLDGIGVGRIRTVPLIFFSDSSENQIAGLVKQKKRKNQPITMPGLFFGFRLRL